MSHALQQLRVGSAMTKDPVTIAADATIAEALQQVEGNDLSTYPVVSNGRTFIGFVTEARLRRTAAEGGRDEEVGTIVQTSPRMQPGDTLVRAIVRMEKSGARQLDIVRAHARAAMDAGEAERTESPLGLD